MSIPFADEDARTFRVVGETGFCGIALLVLALFAGLVAILPNNAPPESRWVIAVCLLAGVTVWAAIGVRLTVRWLRYQLLVDGAHIEARSVSRPKAIEFRDIENAEWQLLTPRLRLTSANETLTIRFFDFARDDRRWLIRRLRESIPQAVQQEWEVFDFCFAQREFAPPPECPAPQKTIVRYPEWRWWLGVIYVGLLILGGVLCLLTTEVKFAVVPILFLPLVFLIPRPEPARKRPEKQVTETESRLGLGSLGLLLGIGLPLIVSLLLRGQHELDWVDFASVAAGVVAMILVWIRCIRRGEQLDRQSAERAARQWAGRPPWDPARERIPY